MDEAADGEGVVGGDNDDDGKKRCNVLPHYSVCFAQTAALELRCCWLVRCCCCYFAVASLMLRCCCAFAALVCS